MVSFSFDVQGMDMVHMGLRNIPARTKPFLVKAVEKTAYDVKNDTKANIQNIPQARRTIGRLGHLANAARYDAPKLTGEIIETKVEFHGSQARLIGVIEHGSPTSAPKWPLKRAGEANQENFIEGVSKAIADGIQ